VAAGRATAPDLAPAAPPQGVERVLPDDGAGAGFPGPSERAVQRAGAWFTHERLDDELIELIASRNIGFAYGSGEECR